MTSFITTTATTRVLARTAGILCLALSVCACGDDLSLSARGLEYAGILHPTLLARPRLSEDMQFGSFMDTDGETLVIGAPETVSVETDSQGQNYIARGGAYVFERKSNEWVEAGFVGRPEALDVRELLGVSLVLVHGDVIALNGHHMRDGSYPLLLFERDGGTWGYAGALARDSWEMWGAALHGVTIALVGRKYLDTDADCNLVIYERDANGWQLAQQIDEPCERFALNWRGGIAMSDSVIAVRGDHGVTVYERNADAWVETQVLAGDCCLDPEKQLCPIEVAVEDRQIAFGEQTCVRIFENAGSGWTEGARLVPSNADQVERFAGELKFEDQRILIGTYYEISRTLGVNNFSELPTLEQDRLQYHPYNYYGAVYLFEKSEGVWTQRFYIKRTSEASVFFPLSIGLGGNSVLVGESIYYGGDWGVVQMWNLTD